jgi:drug/metabolite transporter (DMT)-like permease
MTPAVFGVVLFAAALHASWNALVKRSGASSGGDTLLTTVMVAGSSGLIAIVVLPFIASPAPASWPFIAASSVLQVAYYLLLARAYHVADMSLTYPLMRGLAPLMVALASAFWIGEFLPAGAWLGIGAICAGILSMAVSVRRGGSLAGVRPAVINAVVIASYTLVDGLGVRRSGAPAAYTLWLSLLSGLALVIWVLARRREAFARTVRSGWPLGLIGGAGTIGSYGLALWAMTTAPVAMVAALRETSILFGTAISGLVLHERVGKARIIAVCIIAAGAVALRLA